MSASKWIQLLGATAALLWGPAALSLDNRVDGRVFTRRASVTEPFASARLDVLESNEILSVGTNNMRFRFSKTGTWLGLYPTWNDGRSLFLDGGFLVTGTDANGRLQLLSTTVPIGTKSAGPGRVEISRLEHMGYGRCCEGNEGGNRAPTVNPDDDRDGRIDEDTFDGTDNDGDGLVDEDFAAIGDEMVVLEYQAVSDRGMGLMFHQENSTWSLPYIDGLIAIRLTVKNNGREPVKQLRIGACLHMDGPFMLARKQLANRPGDTAPFERATALVWTNPKEVSVGLLFPERPNGAGGGTGWLFWASKSGEALENSLQNAIATGSETTAPASPGTRTEADARLGDGRFDFDRNMLAGAISSNLGDLEAGGSRQVTLLLVAIPKSDSENRALTIAHRTYLGDGSNRLIPPVVAMTPYLVWGSYNRAGLSDDGLIVTFEDNPNYNFEPDRITFLAGVDEKDLEITNGEGNVTELHIHGRSAQRLQQQSNDRIFLKGRDGEGAFFDAVLIPAGSGAPANSETTPADAEKYWQTAGKLPEALLTGSPNPFRGQTTIFYEVPSVIETEDGVELHFEGSVETSLKIFDVTGRLVTILVDEVSGPGRYQTGWQAADENGSSVASGVYYIKLQIDKRYITKRLILLK
jgi:hypothetical protein